MTSLDAYKAFLIKFNKNDSNRNINVPKGQFVLIYNEQAEIWEDERVDKGVSSDDLDDIDELLTLDAPLTKDEEFRDFTNFTVPADFFRYSTSYSLATKASCSQTVLYNWEIKNKNKNNFKIDAHNKPSFEYQETFVVINADKLGVYHTDFTVDKVFLDYYRLPIKIDVSGYIKVDGTQSTDINPDISNKLVNEIIDYCVKEATRIYENVDGFKLADERIKK